MGEVIFGIPMYALKLETPRTEPRMRAYLKMANFLTVEDSLQLAAGIFNTTLRL
jgi:hypothetical protein